MKREILFRGIRYDGTGWEYGHFITRKHHRNISSYIFNDGINIEVKPETVGQFTGLLDKNGTKIFEGDVVLVRGTKRTGLYKTNVIFKNHGFFLDKNKTYMNDSCVLIAVQNVIGNIHEQ